jgi:hypothetical protein
MLASLVGIDRLREADVGRVVVTDDAFRALHRDLRFQRRRIPFIGRRVPAVVEWIALRRLEAPFGIDAGAAAFAWVGVLAGEGLEGHGVRIRSIETRHRTNVCST